ncbi:MAG: hypothetical protein ABSC48_15875 [Terracidiphilus sp.]
MTPLAIERAEGKAPDTLIFRFTGPVTLRNLFGMQEQLRGGALPAVTILDLSGVPYMIRRGWARSSTITSTARTRASS